MTRLFWATCLATTILLVAPASANDAASNCNAIQNETDRLACYDERESRARRHTPFFGAWGFDETDAFRICQATEATKKDSLRDCMNLQQTAHRASNEVLSRLREFDHPLLEILLAVCRDPERSPPDWIDVYECVAAIHKTKGWDERVTETADQLRSYYGKRENAAQVGTAICINHQTYGRYFGYPVGSYERILFLGGCVNSFATALTAWRF